VKRRYPFPMFVRWRRDRDGYVILSWTWPIDLWVYGPQRSPAGRIN
jgi:hypothetical protein